MYTFNSRIRYSEVNAQGFLSMEGLMNYFQDCSTFQSEDSGIGLAYLGAKHQAWVVNAWQVDVKRYPELGEKVIVGTIPYEIRGFVGSRNFFMDTEAGEHLAVANSLWALVDMDKGVPVRVTQDILDGYPLEEKLPMEYMGRKISFPEEETKEIKDSILVQQVHLDTNQHVNNGQYIRMALGALGTDEGKIIRLRAEYKKQAHLGDQICPVCYYRTEDNKQIETVALNAESGDTYCSVEITEMR